VPVSTSGPTDRERKILAAIGSNVFPAGGFDRLDAQGWPVEWSRPAQAQSVFVRQDPQGDRFVELLSASLDAHRPTPVQITATLPLEPAWRYMQFSAKLLVKEPPVDPEHPPRVTVAWLDADQKQLGQSVELTVSKLSTWTIATSPVIEVPAKAVVASFTPTLPGPGSLSVNDLRAIANPEFQPLPAGFAQGSFEKLDAAKQPLGWDIPPASRRVMLLEEDGNHYLRIVADKPTNHTEHSVIYRLDPRWTQLTVTARLRTPGNPGNPAPGISTPALGIPAPAPAPGSPALAGPATSSAKPATPEKSANNTPASSPDAKLAPPGNRLEVSLLSKDRRPLPDSTRTAWPTQPNKDWQRVSMTVTVPPDGVYLRVNATVTGQASALDVDDVQIERVPAQPEK
jgi:hypothetical protein